MDVNNIESPSPDRMSLSNEVLLHMQQATLASLPLSNSSLREEYFGIPAPPATFDLSNTTLTVSHALVRPDDRGKEVLFFTMLVNPGNGNQSWKVEKTFSELLRLDQRMRSIVGKEVGMKIANLPDGKLWKGHVPLRVDQRKVSYDPKSFVCPC